MKPMGIGKRNKTSKKQRTIETAGQKEIQLSKINVSHRGQEHQLGLPSVLRWT